MKIGCKTGCEQNRKNVNKKEKIEIFE